MEFLEVSWEEVEDLCEELGEKIKKDFQPDWVVGISRGGLVPARLISDILGIHNIAIMRIEFYKDIGKTLEFPRITQPLVVDVKDKKVLIVDDVSDTGRSLMVAKDHIKQKGASEIKIATLHFKPHSSFKPDYFVGVTDRWILYPWEKHEIARSLKGD